MPFLLGLVSESGLHLSGLASKRVASVLKADTRRHVKLFTLMDSRWAGGFLVNGPKPNIGIPQILSKKFTL